MKLKDQVTSLELSKRLKDLSVKQESLFWHIEWRGKEGSSYIASHDISIYKTSASSDGSRKIITSAFTASELGEMLKWNVHYAGTWYMLNGYKTVLENYVRYSNGHGGDLTILIDTNDKNEANARAQMLIYLIENKLTEIKL